MATKVHSNSALQSKVNKTITKVLNEQESKMHPKGAPRSLSPSLARNTVPALNLKVFLERLGTNRQPDRLEIDLKNLDSDKSEESENEEIKRLNHIRY
jgi:hypothetical protein